MNIVYTVCNRSNLAHALLLAESVRIHQPHDTFFLCWVDDTPISNLPEAVNFISVDQLHITEWDRMAGQYSDFELLAACRPWFALDILRKNADCTQLTFLAPTVQLFHPMAPITASGAELYLTANITAPLPSSKNLDDKRILNIGMFHAGSWILRASQSTTTFLKWWAERTLDRARFDLCNGMNMDQLWLNYAPIWIASTSVIRHPGWHYGLQAVLGKKLVRQGDIYAVDGQPLVSADFAGLDYYDPVWSDHVPLLHHNHVFRTLFEQYQETLKTIRRQNPQHGKPGFGKIIQVKKNRLLRNNIARKLKSINTYIDQF